MAMAGMPEIATPAATKPASGSPLSARGKKREAPVIAINPVARANLFGRPIRSATNFLGPSDVAQSVCSAPLGSCLA